MNNNAEPEVRPRPLSAGLWTLFSWLRREDRFDSSESLSSAGSDRTVASFSFLTPAHYQPATNPLVLPPPGPPTDTYKKRVHDRNIRRQYDRDITLHRKYGLLKSSETTCGYDAFSLPPVRRINGDSSSRRDREKRATSECFHRRLAHVPGKRRAPQPPISAIPTTPPSSLNRGNTRKRRAPQPPVKLNVQNKENINHLQVDTSFKMAMNSDKQKLNNDASMGHKSEKYSKKEESAKDTKVKLERSFLKQIFDGKKRNSNIDITSVKLLPSISELDKQAAEIIETCKLNATEKHNNVNNSILDKVDNQRARQSENWICANCLRKYNSGVNICLHCVQRQNVTMSNRNCDDVTSVSKASDSYTQTEKTVPKSVLTNKTTADEKQKLKEMLKEMKDSLPKKAKHDLNIEKDTKIVAVPSSQPTTSYSTETPTLRVGSNIQSNITALSSHSKNSTSNHNETITVINSQIPRTVQPSSLLISSELDKNCENIDEQRKSANITNKVTLNSGTSIQNVKQIKIINNRVSEPFGGKKDLHTPLKISSLLNPVYVPKNLDTNQLQTPIESQNDLKGKQKLREQNISNPESTSRSIDNVTKSTMTSTLAGITSNVAVSSSKECKRNIDVQSKYIENKNVEKNPLSAVTRKDMTFVSKFNNKNTEVIASALSKDERVHEDTQDQYSRRRNLIYQLEQSIAKGDEKAAAEAAAKLAQLRLSCSVLSFSSQILSQPPTCITSPMFTESEKNMIMPNKTSTQNNLPNTSLRVEPQVIQISPVKDISPQKVVVSNILLNADKVKKNLGPAATPEKSSIGIEQMDKFSLKSEAKADIKKEEPFTKYEMITIAVLVEDREATRGPVHLLIRRQALMRDLRREAEASLGVATNLQRWIVGRVLCVDDNTPVATLAGPNFSAPFYLCVVESETKAEQTPQLISVKELKNKNDSNTKASNVYTELVELEQQALVPNSENFECDVCMEEYPPGRGVVLRECVHVFCKNCLSDVVRHCEEPDILCPAMGCRGMLQEREIRALVTPQDYERWLARGLAAAESGIRNAFHCRTRDCKGWVLCEPGVQRFPCPVCKHVNCVLCQAIHDGETCQQHKVKLMKASAAGKSDTDDGTRSLLTAMITKGEALECPECSAVITKKWGCDWVKCSACKTEICWVTRGRRWGPGGKGDTSGGCRCGVDGKRCHPSCNYCH